MSNSKPLDTLNEQMNLLVESQAQEINELKASLNSQGEGEAHMGAHIEKLEEENKEKEDMLNAYRSMMMKCDSMVEFDFGCQNTPEINPENLNDMEHIPYYINEITEQNEKLTKEKFDYNIFLEEKTNMAVMLSQLHSENEKLKEDVKGLKDDAQDEWLGMFGVLNDAGYSATSTGQLVSFVRDIIEEKAELEGRYEDHVKSLLIPQEDGSMYMIGMKDYKELKEQLNTIFPSKTEQEVISKYQVQRTNNIRTIKKLIDENEKLKKDYDKNWAAMECLSFMDYKYEDGEWKPYED
jgi:hypothetical protein